MHARMQSKRCRKTVTVDRDKLATIEFLLFMLYELERKMAAELDKLKAAVARNTDTGNSVVVLLKGLKKKLDEAIASGDPAELTALSDALDTETQALKDAVIENTPAEDVPDEPAL